MNNLRPPSQTPDRATSWRDALAVYLEARVLILFAMGFSSGLPLLLVLGTLSFRLREAGIDRMADAVEVAGKLDADIPAAEAARRRLAAAYPRCDAAP